MSKYPCGICTIGVKYKGILCTGGCDRWFHSKCLNWPDRQLKNFSKSDIEAWQCQECHKMSDYDPSTVSPAMEKINSKLLNYDNIEKLDLETSLTLAAEVGNTLLVENASLKEEVHKLTLNNSKLILKMKKTENLNNESILSDQIETLLNEKQTILESNVNLVEKLNEAENQLSKEIKLRYELTATYEEHDRQNEETISKLEQLNHSLKHEMKHLKQSKQFHSNQSNKTKSYSDMETQTSLSEVKYYNTNSSLLKELTEIKIKQNEMELILKSLAKQIQHPQPNHNIDTSLPKQTIQIHSHKVKPSNTGRKKNESAVHNNNVYSVALKMTKYNSNCGTKHNQILQTPYKTTQDLGTTIDQYTQRSGGASQTPSQKLNNPTSTQDLGLTSGQPSEKSGGDSQTPPQKLNNPTSTQDLGLTSGQLPEKIGGASQTPPQKLNNPTMAQDLDLTSGEPAEKRGGASQTLTEKLDNLSVTKNLNINQTSGHFLVHMHQKRTKFKTRYFLNSNIRHQGPRKNYVQH